MILQESTISSTPNSNRSLDDIDLPSPSPNRHPPQKHSNKHNRHHTDNLPQPRKPRRNPRVHKRARCQQGRKDIIRKRPGEVELDPAVSGGGEVEEHEDAGEGWPNEDGVSSGLRDGCVG